MSGTAGGLIATNGGKINESSRPEYSLPYPPPSTGDSVVLEVETIWLLEKKPTELFH